MSSAAKRPQRRQSGLAGSSPVRPAADTFAVTPRTDTASPADAATVSTTAKTPKPKYPPKVSFYQNPEDTARVRGALRGVMNQPGAATNMSQFIHRAVMREVERIEVEYNNGKPFPSAQAGDVPRGRPMSESSSLD